MPYIDMNKPCIYMYSPSQSPHPPPSPPNPSGSSQCTSPEHLSHASNLGRWSVSSLIIYMFQCCSLKTSHPCLLPQSPKVCSVKNRPGFPGGASGKKLAYRCRRHEIQVWSQGWDDPLEEDMATYSSILAWIIPRTEEPVRLQSIESLRVRHNLNNLAFMHPWPFLKFCFGETHPY